MVLKGHTLHINLFHYVNRTCKLYLFMLNVNAVREVGHTGHVLIMCICVFLFMLCVSFYARLGTQ